MTIFFKAISPVLLICSFSVKNEAACEETPEEHQYNRYQLGKHHVKPEKVGTQINSYSQSDDANDRVFHEFIRRRSFLLRKDKLFRNELIDRLYSPKSRQALSPDDPLSHTHQYIKRIEIRNSDSAADKGVTKKL
ncbi:hypothetical protein [Solibaculum intestinale]|uniref:YARHG domain-containing protein n=1 Tax=Solibaculum intestinale TaxID=3133165 RepID=A0ABV1DWH5_9FIRM